MKKIIAIMLVLASMLASWTLSKTLLKGVPTSFALELPPFRRPRIGQILVRSLIDRTLFVAGRALMVAAPAGILLWILANSSLLGILAQFLDPVGQILEMNGVILLAFCMALLAIPLAVSGASGVELRWLGPELMPWPVGLTLVLLLPNLPSAGEGTKGIPGAVLLTLALSALVQGSISLKVASTTGSPIYETARTIGHLEPVTAAALTLGWYALASLFLDSAARIAQEGDIRMEVAYVLVWCTAAVFVLFGLQPNAWFVTVLSLFWWVITPFFQKMKKLENSA